jgi:hypothetical protein
MAYRVDKKALLSAARHLGRFGDTDVFPHLPELTFLSDNEDEVVDELATLDLDAYEPSSSFEALAPKSRYGFRIVHQLPFVDTILLLASVVEIGEKIEAVRPPISELTVCSYRFKCTDDGQIFAPNCTYKDWLVRQLDRLKADLKVQTRCCNRHF